MKNKNIIYKCIIIIVLLISSVCLYLSYPTVYKNSIDKYNQHIIEDYILNNTSKLKFILDDQLKGNQKNYQKYINQNNASLEMTKEVTEAFTSNLNSIDKDLCIDYYAIDTQSKKVVTNTKNALNSIHSSKETNQIYQFYFQVSYDEDGTEHISFIGPENNHFIHFQNVTDFQSRLYDYEPHYDYLDENSNIISSVLIDNPKNIVIIYAIPKVIPVASSLATQLNNNVRMDRAASIQYILPYALIGIIVCSLVVFISPMKESKNKLLSFFAELKFEILATLWIALLVAIFVLISIFIPITLTNEIIRIYQEFAIEYMAPFLTPCANICLWFAFLTLFAFLAYMIKYLFHKGLKGYFFENTILGWIIVHIKKIATYILSFDFDDNTNRIIIKIVGINFITICFISFFFVGGPIIALIYSIFLFFVLKNKFIEIKDDYQVLLKATKELSNGHFNYKINEDIGIFNPLKHEFSHIREGFEKAVNEEVKSQKTKTELISNVSHDLKTPLTSIITYVDLLKDKTLTDDQRNDYVRILEKNSLRLKNLIEDLFEVSKANTGDIKLDIVDLDIISMIKQVELEYQDQFIEKGLEIRTQFIDEKIICSLDSSKTYRIFENLFVNMTKYALENTRVYIQIECDQDNVYIIFKNISKDEMNFNENEIVERFVQGDKSRNTSGSGLGLAIVKSFTEIQGGRFSVQLDGDLFKTIIQFKKKDDV